jgi:hypothetical protein
MHEKIDEQMDNLLKKVIVKPHLRLHHLILQLK